MKDEAIAEPANKRQVFHYLPRYVRQHHEPEHTPRSNPTQELVATPAQPASARAVVQSTTEANTPKASPGKAAAAGSSSSKSMRTSGKIKAKGGGASTEGNGAPASRAGGASTKSLMSSGPPAAAGADAPPGTVGSGTALAETPPKSKKGKPSSPNPARV